jgi:glycosyltransferase involved in cell wall biosynthesis
MPAAHSSPRLSVVIPTFDNLDVLRRCLDAWRANGGTGVELIVVEDGCRDDTPAYLDEVGATEWGARQLRWIHQQDAHELRCTNAGFAAAGGEFMMAWQDDMFLRVRWLVPELLRTFDGYPDIGMISLSRGLNCLPFDEPIDRWDQLIDWRRLQSTIGPAPWNWFRLQEVDAVIRPWIVRRACVERVGDLDEAFRPTEWDEADLAFRIRKAGWRIATSGYERLGAYEHLGSTTISRAPSAPYLARVLDNGRLFHARWDETIAADHARARRTWMRRTGVAGWMATVREMSRFGLRRLAGAAE